MISCKKGGKKKIQVDKCYSTVNFQVKRGNRRDDKKIYIKIIEF